MAGKNKKSSNKKSSKNKKGAPKKVVDKEKLLEELEEKPQGNEAEDTMEALQAENARLRTKHGELQKRIKHHHQESAQEVKMMEKRKQMLDVIMAAFDEAATFQLNAPDDKFLDANDSYRTTMLSLYAACLIAMHTSMVSMMTAVDSFFGTHHYSAVNVQGRIEAYFESLFTQMDIPLTFMDEIKADATDVK